MACRNHPSVENGLEHCYRCGYSFCEECRIDFQGKPHCAECRAEAVFAVEVGDERGPGAAGRELPPWERRQELGMATAFWQTIKAVVGDPAGFFRNMDTSVTTWDCLVVPCVLVVISTISMSIAMALFLGAFFAVMMKELGVEPEQAGGMVFGQGFGLCGGIISAPVSAIVGVFITAGLIHVFLMMAGKVGAPFHQTMRGYCYSQAPLIVTVVPVLGHIVATFWSIWTAVVMVKEVHRTSWGTAWVSVLWYMVLMCVVCGGVYAVIVAAVIAAQQG